VVNGILYAGIQPGDRVAVVWTGYMGLLFVQGLSRSLTGFIMAFDTDVRRLDLARQFGAGETVDLGIQKLEEGLKKRFDVVIETAGTADSMNVATSILRAGGILENFAWHRHTHTFDLEEANGAISNERLVTHVEKLGKAFDLFTVAAGRTGGYLKGVVIF
jgi:alcohol dehydrogenase